MVIDFTVENQRLKCNTDLSLIERSKNYIKCRFTFSADWNVLYRLALFLPTGDTIPYPAEIDDNGECLIPANVAYYGGQCKLAVFGSNVKFDTDTEIDADDVIISTNTVRLHFEPTVRCDDLAENEDVENPFFVTLRQNTADIEALKKEVAEIDTTGNVPTKVSELENDLGYLTDYTETDPTVPEWAKQPTKPTYTADEVGALPDTTEIPSKVSQLKNDSGYLTEHQDISGKADKPTITESTDTVLSFEFSTNHNTEIRTGELTTISFTFGNGEYAEDYASGLSFDSGATPTAIDYTDSGILNWVGTDCVTSDGLSIFQPSANTHYDIVFYFNGVQFIGLVNGFVPATGNEAV